MKQKPKGWRKDHKRHSKAAKKGWEKRKAKQRLFKRGIKYVFPPVGIADDLYQTASDFKTLRE